MKGKVVIVRLSQKSGPASGKNEVGVPRGIPRISKTRLVRSECGRLIRRNRIVGER